MKVTTTETGGVITYNSADWRAGLAPQGLFQASAFLKHAGVNGFSSISKIDPFIKYGVLSPGIAPSANATNSGSLLATIVALEMTDNSTSLAVDSGGRIQRITSSALTPVISTDSPFPRTIAFTAGSTYVGQDGILYRHNSGGTTSADSKVSFFYSAYNSNNWDVGAYVNLGTFDDDFMSSVPANPLDITTGDGDDVTQRAKPHPMEIGADGILYIGSGRFLHAYDGNTGSNGTFFSKVLTLPQGTEIISMKKYQDILLIATNYYSSGNTTGTGEALLYNWNYLDLDITSVTPLEDFYVSTIFLWQGSPCVITSGTVERNGKFKIKIISGNQVTKLADFDGVMPVDNGTVVLGDMFYMNCGGKILSCGDKYMSGNDYFMNNVAILSANGISGVLAWNALRDCFMGSSSGGTPCFNNIGNGLDSGGCSTPFYYPEIPFGKIAKIKAVQVEFYTEVAQAGANGNLTFAIGVDNYTGLYTIFTNLSSVSLPLRKRYTRTATANTLINASFASGTCFNLIFNWGQSTSGTSPTISSVAIEYDLLEIKN